MNKLPVGEVFAIHDRMFGTKARRTSKVWATLAHIWSNSPVPMDWRRAAAMWYCASELEDDSDVRREHWLHLSDCQERYMVRIGEIERK